MAVSEQSHAFAEDPFGGKRSDEEGERVEAVPRGQQRAGLDDGAREIGDGGGQRVQPVREDVASGPA